METDRVGPLDLCALGFFPTNYRTWYGFTSIPVEYRHQKFKRDLRNTFQGFKYLNPGRCRGYLQRVVQLDALDVGLRVLSWRPPDVPTETLFEPVQPDSKKRARV